MSIVALRMDDVGAASKRYEVYSRWRAGVGPLQVSGNWLFLKYLPPFRAWGPYRELNAEQWREICECLDASGARLTVAITAGWVERRDRIVPYPERFPQAAEAVRDGVKAGLLEVANHGWTHCVLEGDRYKPRWFSGNRSFHREFWDWVPADVQAHHLHESQRVLQTYFGVPVVTFVPPGNVFGDRTLEIARTVGLRYVSCDAPIAVREGLAVLGNQHVVPFHDRDVVLHGVGWLRQVIAAHQGHEFVFVKHLPTPQGSVS